MQQSLALASATGEVTRLAVMLNLAHVPLHGFPTADLTLVLFRYASTQVVPAVPLEPAARVVRMHPFLRHTDSGWLAFTPK